MGRVIRREVVAIRCELKRCDAYQIIEPIPVSNCASEQEQELRRLVRDGWGLVLTPQLRSYCPAHAEHVWRCTCRTNPDRAHLCTVHSSEAAQLVRCPGSPAAQRRRHDPLVLGIAA